MNPTSKLNYLAILLTTCLPSWAGARLHAQNAELPDVVRSALDRYSKLDAIAVEYRESTESAPLGRETIDPKVLARITNNKYAFSFAFREGRMYLRREPLGQNIEKSNTMEAAFDLRILYVGTPERTTEGKKNKAGLSKWMPGKDYPQAGYFTHDYFQAAGVRFPTRVQELLLDSRPQAELLARLNQGGRIEAIDEAEVEGHRLLRVRMTAQDSSMIRPPANLAAMEDELRKRNVNQKEIEERLADARQAQTAPQRQFEYFLDPDLGYAARRIDTRDESGHLLTRTDCMDIQPLADRKIWLPRRCRVAQYTFVGLKNQVFASPLFVNQISVSSIDLQPWPNQRFELNYTTPGTQVSDATFPEAEGTKGVSYEIPANPEQLDQVIAAARLNYQQRADQERKHGVIYVMLIVVGGCLIAGFLIQRFARRNKAGSAK
jgi:hypothetical protein